MVEGETETLSLLRRWHNGDQGALNEIIRRDLAWVLEQVEKRLGPGLRTKERPSDIVQATLMDLLRYGPRFLVSDKDQFRGLVAVMVENNIRDKNDWWRAQRRTLDKEHPLPSDSVIHVGDDRKPFDGPSTAAQRQEDEALIRLALELIDSVDRQIIVLRQFDGRSFNDIGEDMGMAPNTARMRYKRALPRLAEKLEKLERGQVASLIQDAQGP